MTANGGKQIHRNGRKKVEGDYILVLNLPDLPDSRFFRQSC